MRFALVSMLVVFTLALAACGNEPAWPDRPYNN
jgi:hypothetical protein